MVETTPDLGGGSPRLYRAVRIVAMFLFKVMFRLEVVGEEHVPTEGGFVLAPGAHRSILDTPLAAATTPRILRYMGAEKYLPLRVSAGSARRRRLSGRTPHGRP
ncbi:MAG: hypothetical protein R2710_22445 [Acidimicrobiales bacterium]